MIFELNEAGHGDWDQFQVRNIGFKVQRRMAREFAGDPERVRKQSVAAVARSLKLSLKEWSSDEQALTDLALAVALIPNLDRWERSEKAALVQILRAKVSGEEARYLKLMQKHERFRDALIKLGSSSS